MASTDAPRELDGEAIVAGLRTLGLTDVEQNVPLASRTTLRVGGPAEVLALPRSHAEAAAAVYWAAQNEVALTPIGKGSNLLVADAGVAGITLAFDNLTEVAVDTELHRVTADAGALLPAVAVKAAQAGLAGIGWGVGVPGAVGGAVAMNAGAHGGDMADVLTAVTLAQPQSPAPVVVPANTLPSSYRNGGVPRGAVVLSATMHLAPGDPGGLKAELDTIRTWRRDNQPLGTANCGSVFVNPPGNKAAAQLLEAAGAKGLRVGGAQISAKHANFIEAGPDATASDVADVIAQAKALVADHAGIDLHTEVRHVGRWA